LGPFDAVIFDCDGVLADSEPASVRAWTATVIGLGGHTTEERIGSFIGKTERDLAEHHAPLVGRAADVVELDARERFLDLVASEGVSPFPDAVALLEQVIASGTPVGVGSNSPRWRLNAVLASTGLSVEVSVAGDEVDRPKPAPDVYREVARRLGVAVERSVVVEDTPTGIAAARAAGARVIAVRRGAVPESELSGADLVVDDLGGA